MAIKISLTEKEFFLPEEISKEEQGKIAKEVCDFIVPEYQRNLTRKDMKYIVDWITVYGVSFKGIKEALKVTILKIDEFSAPYTDAVLKSWVLERRVEFQKELPPEPLAENDDEYFKSLQLTIEMCDLIIQNRLILNPEFLKKAELIKKNTEKQIELYKFKGLGDKE